MPISRVKNAIFCDDVRQEINGKLIAIGIYSNGMNIGKFPFEGKLALLLTVDTSDIGHEAKHVQFDLMPDYKDAAEFEFRLEIFLTPDATAPDGSVRQMIVNAPQIPIKIDKPCQLLFREKAEGDGGEVLSTFPLAINQAPAN